MFINNVRCIYKHTATYICDKYLSFREKKIVSIVEGTNSPYLSKIIDENMPVEDDGENEASDDDSDA